MNGMALHGGFIPYSGNLLTHRLLSPVDPAVSADGLRVI